MGMGMGTGMGMGMPAEKEFGIHRALRLTIATRVAHIVNATILIAIPITSLLSSATNPAFAASESTSGKMEILSYVDESQLSLPPAFVWGHDPFEKRPGFHPTDEGDRALKLEAIIHGGKNPVAIINGQMVSAGSVLPGGERVKQIASSFVVIENGESLLELAIRKSAPKQVQENAPPKNKILEFLEATGKGK
jgi:hypothetical protein